nr:uncharacterized protein LOC117994004 [Maniola hyperantus]
MLTAVLCFATLIVWIECTHIFTLERDFNKITADEDLAKHVEAVLQRLKTFKSSVHPRIRLFYQLLKHGMLQYAHRTAASLYNPSTYVLPAAEARHAAVRAPHRRLAVQPYTRTAPPPRCTTLVHPYYQLLKRGMLQYAHRTAASLYNPSTYVLPAAEARHAAVRAPHRRLAVQP